MQVMGDMGDMFPTNVNKVSKEEIQVNVYGRNLRPHSPHHPQCFRAHGSSLALVHEGNARRIISLGGGVQT